MLFRSVQAGVAALLRASGGGARFGEVPECCAAGVSILLSLVLIAAVRRLEHRS